MFVQALIVALWATAVCATELGAWVIKLQPFIAGSITGLLLGEWETGVLISATIQLIYMGQIQVGGVSAYSFIFAGVIAPAVAIVSNMEPEIATTAAVAIGTLGVVSDNIRMTVNATWVHMADKYVEKGETKYLWVFNWVLPSIVHFTVYGIPAFLAVYFGAEYLEGFMASLPTWITDGLAAIGTLLPALGIGMMFKVVYNKKLVAFAILGYIAAGYLGLPTIGTALLALVCALLYWNLVSNKNKEEVK